VKFVNLKVLDRYGEGADSAVIAAIQKAIQLKTQYNIRIINLSLDRPGTGSLAGDPPGRPAAGISATDPLGQAVEAAWKAGIVVVAAGDRLSGAPMASGAAALMLQKNPSLTPDTIKARLMKTAGKRFPPVAQAAGPATGASHTVQHNLFTGNNNIVWGDIDLVVDNIVLGDAAPAGDTTDTTAHGEN
jgi:hypothetical protein